MKKLKSLLCIPCLLLLFFISDTAAQNQNPCLTWSESARGKKAEEAHVLYRQYLKNDQYGEAFKYWQKAYKLAPAADGNRPFHYVDGRELYMQMYQQETDETKKGEYAAAVLRLYDEQMQCYGDEDVLLGHKARDMYYNLKSPYPQLWEVLKQAVEKGDTNTTYSLLVPFAEVLVSQLKTGQITLEEARNYYMLITRVADNNIANRWNNLNLFPYRRSKEEMNVVLAEVEGDLFECEFFIQKFEPLFRENPQDYEGMKYYYNKMLRRGCSEEHPLLKEIKASYETKYGPIPIAAEGALTPPPPPEPTYPETQVFKIVEEMPRFPGCEDISSDMLVKNDCVSKKMLEYINGNLQYPAIARENGVEGTVVVLFVVEKDGTLSDIRVARDIGAGCGNEAIRLVESMNTAGLRWIPGKQRGNLVRVQFMLLVKFKLDKK